MQIKQVDCKVSTKNVNNYKEKTFRDISGQLHTQKYKATQKQIVRLQLNQKKPDKINELILKTNTDLKEGPDNI